MDTLAIECRKFRICFLFQTIFSVVQHRASSFLFLVLAEPWRVGSLFFAAASQIARLRRNQFLLVRRANFLCVGLPQAMLGTALFLGNLLLCYKSEDTTAALDFAC